MKERKHRPLKQAALLGLLATGMFGFAFAMVPLYEIFCEITGINGKSYGQTVSSEPVEQTDGREVTIEFLSHVGRGMPWEFRPTQSRMRVRVGEVHEARYYARNFASREVTGQAVPSVTPGWASKSLHKIECFCFTQQTLEPDGDMEMPVKFYVSDDLPMDLGTLSLSYTLYPVPTDQTATGSPQQGDSEMSSMDHGMDHGEHTGS